MRLHDVSALAHAARELLSQGDAVGAERVLAPVFNQLKIDPAVLHLMGLIKKAQNKLDDAERHLRSAVAYSLSDGSYYNELAVVVQLRGDYTEALKLFRAALALMPGAPAVRVNLVRCLMASGDLNEAEREARAYIAADPGAESWTLLGQVQRAQERYDEALVSAEAALKYSPGMRGLRYNHATALDRVGRAQEALEVYEKLARQEVDNPELALNYARALYAQGQQEEAAAVAEQAVSAFPTSIPLHALLARIRWLDGAGEKCTALLEAEITRRPRDLALRLACADALHRGKHLTKALTVLNDAVRLAPDTPQLLTALGIVLDEIDRPRDGVRMLRRVVEITSGARSSQRNLLSTLLRAGEPGEALKISRALQQEEPDEQYLIACETTALRMLGDPAYKELCDFDRFVRTYELSAPRGFFTAEAFNAALAETLRPQHKTNAHPLDQYLHNGTQTGRSLITWDERNIKIFMAAADQAVRDYIKGFEADDAHPLKRRRVKHYRYAGLWSVRLGHEGYQPNHVHDRGWVSSAYYAALMPAERPKDPRAGWLKLGEPNRAPAGCGPERWIEPKVGTLVLFPSYFWHGTAPFEGSERLSLAFDVTPG